MDHMLFAGIFFIGFVFGYLLYYAVRHTANFNIELLSSAIGAVGGGVVIGWLGHTPGWIGPYGIGLGAGFLSYLVLSLILIGFGRFQQVASKNVLLVRTLLGKNLTQ